MRAAVHSLQCSNYTPCNIYTRLIQYKYIQYNMMQIILKCAAAWSSTDHCLDIIHQVINCIYFVLSVVYFVLYYPPRDVFALNTGKYRPGCIFFCTHRRPGTMDNEWE